MTHIRAAQHRPQRDEQQRNQDEANLKRLNRILKRQVQRLQKENDKLRGVIVEEPQEPPETLAVTAPEPGCPTCGSKALKSVSLPTGILRVCTTCGYKGKI